MKELISHLPVKAQIEAENIVRFIPKRIRKKLNFNSFNPGHASKCVYGQMFGDCMYLKAREAMKKCAPVGNIGNSNVGANTHLHWTYLSALKANKGTPLEIAIVMPRYAKHNEDLLKFLKQ